jgi:predicted amidophosphoribosyltransferase
LAKYFSKASNLQLISALKLVRNKLPQHTLSRAERIENIKGAFGFIDKYEVKGKTVLLIHDIMTTGATFNECAKVLKRAGAKRVYGLMATINI